MKGQSASDKISKPYTKQNVSILYDLCNGNQEIYLGDSGDRSFLEQDKIAETIVLGDRNQTEKGKYKKCFIKIKCFNCCSL